jgi:hypothetical protein
MFSNLEKAEITVLKIWNVDFVDGQEVFILRWERETHDWGEEQEQIKRNLQELNDFFDSKSKPNQLKLR